MRDGAATAFPARSVGRETNVPDSQRQQHVLVLHDDIRLSVYEKFCVATVGLDLSSLFSR